MSVFVMTHTHDVAREVAEIAHGHVPLHVASFVVVRSLTSEVSGSGSGSGDFGQGERVSCLLMILLGR